MNEVVRRAESIVRSLRSCAINSTAYPTACAARLRDDDDRAVFPETLEWLRRKQHDDGSWGSVIAWPPDRLISTCAAVDALSSEPSAWARTAVKSGISYLNNIADWRYQSHDELMAFELALPPLLERVRKLGVAVPDDVSRSVTELRAQKLAKVPPGVLANQSTPLLHALDALTDLVPAPAVARFALEDGSIADSILATTTYWNATKDQAALDYLTQAANSTADGGLPEHYSFDTFESAWVMYMLTRAGVTCPGMAASLDWLATLAARAPHGLASTAVFDHPDADDTAIVAGLFTRSGRPEHGLYDALLEFEGGDHFRTYMYERHPSVTVNGHILEALTLHRSRFARQIDKCTSFLLGARHEGGWWTDKWHLSPYYATAQAVFGLSRTAPDALTDTWQWLLDTQHSDGSWGDSLSRPEETAHAALALDALASHFGPPPHHALQRAHQFLSTVLDKNDHPEMWMARSLYLPPAIVKSSILAAYALTKRV